MKRPKFLTVLLVLGILFQSLLIFVYIIGLADTRISLRTPSTASWQYWEIILRPVLIGMNLVALIMLWRWRILGFYIIVVTSVAGIILTVLDNGPSTYTFRVPQDILGILILWLAMKPVWKKFK